MSSDTLSTCSKPTTYDEILYNKIRKIIFDATSPLQGENCAFHVANLLYTVYKDYYLIPPRDRENFHTLCRYAVKACNHELRKYKTFSSKNEKADVVLEIFVDRLKHKYNKEKRKIDSDVVESIVSDLNFIVVAHSQPKSVQLDSVSLIESTGMLMSNDITNQIVNSLGKRQAITNMRNSYNDCDAGVQNYKLKCSYSSTINGKLSFAHKQFLSCTTFDKTCNLTDLFTRSNSMHQLPTSRNMVIGYAYKIDTPSVKTVGTDKACSCSTKTKNELTELERLVQENDTNRIAQEILSRKSNKSQSHRSQMIECDYVKIEREPQLHKATNNSDCKFKSKESAANFSDSSIDVTENTYKLRASQSSKTPNKSYELTSKKSDSESLVIQNALIENEKIHSEKLVECSQPKSTVRFTGVKSKLEVAALQPNKNKSSTSTDQQCKSMDIGSDACFLKYTNEQSILTDDTTITTSYLEENLHSDHLTRSKIKIYKESTTMTEHVANDSANFNFKTAVDNFIQSSDGFMKKTGDTIFSEDAGISSITIKEPSESSIVCMLNNNPKPKANLKAEHFIFPSVSNTLHKLVDKSGKTSQNTSELRQYIKPQTSALNLGDILNSTVEQYQKDSNLGSAPNNSMLKSSIVNFLGSNVDTFIDKSAKYSVTKCAGERVEELLDKPTVKVHKKQSDIKNHQNINVPITPIFSKNYTLKQELSYKLIDDRISVENIVTNCKRPKYVDEYKSFNNQHKEKSLIQYTDQQEETILDIVNMQNNSPEPLLPSGDRNISENVRPLCIDSNLTEVHFKANMLSTISSKTQNGSDMSSKSLFSDNGVVLTATHLEPISILSAKNNSTTKKYYDATGDELSENYLKPFTSTDWIDELDAQERKYLSKIKTTVSPYSKSKSTSGESTASSSFDDPYKIIKRKRKLEPVINKGRKRLKQQKREKYIRPSSKSPPQSNPKLRPGILKVKDNLSGESRARRTKTPERKRNSRAVVQRCKTPGKIQKRKKNIKECYRSTKNFSSSSDTGSLEVRYETNYGLMDKLNYYKMHRKGYELKTRNLPSAGTGKIKSRGKYPQSPNRLKRLNRNANFCSSARKVCDVASGFGNSMIRSCTTERPILRSKTREKARNVGCSTVTDVCTPFIPTCGIVPQNTPERALNT